MGTEILIIILLSFCIDLSLGEFPSSIHPVVWMGKLIETLKKHFLNNSKYIEKLYGFIITLLLIILFVFLFTIILIFFSFSQIIFLIAASFLLSTTFSVRTLLRSAQMVAEDLDEDIDKGRKSLSFLVSRPTSKLSSQEVISATIETLTENIVDSVVAPLFYGVILAFFGIAICLNYSNYFSDLFNPGLSSSYQLLVIITVAASVSYRVVNTLDAMVGYKDPVNRNIGWFPAKFDDFLNFIPARITGFLMIIAAFIISLDYSNSWKTMLKDARNTPSPNSGYPMAAAAGALNVQLIKPGIYKLGEPEINLTINKIKEGIKLSTVTIILFIATLSFLITLINLLHLFY